VEGYSEYVPQRADQTILPLQFAICFRWELRISVDVEVFDLGDLRFLDIHIHDMIERNTRIEIY
jgi:hypothetical protein